MEARVHPAHTTCTASTCTFKDTARGSPDPNTKPPCVSSSLVCVILPLYVGTTSFQLPINDPVFSGAGHKGENVLALNIGLDGSKLFSDPGSAFSPSVSRSPDWSNFSPNLPSIFALLADPSTVVDGLDFFLQTLEGTLQGQ